MSRGSFDHDRDMFQESWEIVKGDMTKALHAILGKEKSQPQIVLKDLRGLQEEYKDAKPQDLPHWLPYITAIQQYIYLIRCAILTTIANTVVTGHRTNKKRIHQREERQNLEDELSATSCSSILQNHPGQWSWSVADKRVRASTRCTHILSKYELCVQVRKQNNSQHSITRNPGTN